VGGSTENQPVLKHCLGGLLQTEPNIQEGNMGTLKLNREVGTVDVRLDKHTSVHLITSYPPRSASSTLPDQEIERSWEDFPDDEWPSDAWLVAADVDAEEWPGWTDEARFGLVQGGAP
jgi:hypothetical protein